MRTLILVAVIVAVIPVISGCDRAKNTWNCITVAGRLC